MDKFWDSFPVLGIALSIEEGKIEFAGQKELLAVARANDTRYIQWAWYLELTLIMEESEQDLTRTNAASFPSSVPQCLKHFESIRAIQLKHLAELSNRKVKLVVAASIVATFIFTKGLDVLWKHLERWFELNVGQ